MTVAIISKIVFRPSIIFVAGLLLLTACQQQEGEVSGQAENKYAGDMVLAISWQPGFCETRPRLRECKSQTAKRFDATHFTLHGLWPQPGSNVYCDVSEKEKALDKSRKWKRLQGLGLSDKMKQVLWKIMPGSQSYLHRHEWIKHGTCYSESPETYYADSVSLLSRINESPVQKLFANSVGRSLDGRTIRSAFDKAFGVGVGKRVRVSCKRDGNRTVITELTLGLSGQISNTPDIGALALAARPTKPGCPQGIVDPVGLQ